MMTPTLYRKRLLALAISATSLPLAAQPLTLTNDGIRSTGNTYADRVEVKGSFSNQNVQPLQFHGDVFESDLLLNTTVNATGEDLNGIELAPGQGDSTTTGAPTQVRGDLVNNGALTMTGEEVSGIRTDSAVLQGDLVNAANGRIQADGQEASAIRLEGGSLIGKLINHGLIQVSGEDATGLLATTNAAGDRVDLGGIENHGSIVASGEDATPIKLDGVSFAASPVQVLNSGSIRSDDAAIEVGVFDIDGAEAAGALVIRNSGSLVSGDEAIDASFASGDVELQWDQGSITGNLIDLTRIDVTGPASFTGNDATEDGANIRLKNDGRVRVGGSSTARLELEQPHTLIQGNLEVAENAALGLNLSSATEPNKAVVAVSGTAAFANGSQIQLAARGSDFTATGSTYTLVEAGSLEDAGLSVTSRSALLNVDTFTIEGNRILAKVSTKAEEEVGAEIGNVGGTPNAQRAGAAFSQVVTGLAENNPNDPVFQAYVNASQDPVALKALAEQLTPEVNGGATQAATSGQSLVSNVTGNRTSSLRGASSGDTLKETGVWTQALYSDASQNLRDGVDGFNAYSRGIAIGADGKLSDQLTLGVAYSFLRTGVNSDGGNTTDVDGNALTLYGSFEQGDYFVDANLSYGLNDNESKRRIAGTTAKGDYDSSVLGASLVGGYTYRLSDRFLVEPRLAARYTRVDIDGYREKGSSAALKVEDQRYEVAELGAGVRIAGTIPLGRGNLQPQAKLMAYHDFAADEAKSTSTFMLGGTPFVTQGAGSVRNSYEAGIGADYRLGAITVGLSYDYVGKTDFNADTFTAKVRYDF
ncbi:autotransporter domain-containing protein [Pseudomonas aeruginosa]|uniref:autotransporter family protein n=1 Tax=Pseudomonas aeruginosa TaxID=287 RepID=UPI0029031328|nr:autotransporter domain-containing protein [Pseudomonas aeruginosa]MDU0538063.1 autotransporter domain-containing protein [Pseudomonas aeruginosa]